MRYLLTALVVCSSSVAYAEGAVVFGRWPNGSTFCIVNFNHPTKNEAIDAAMAACADRAFNCRLEATFHNSCIAIAVNRRGGCAYEIHPQKHEAHNGALRRCAKWRINCWIDGSACDAVDEAEVARAREEFDRQKAWEQQKSQRGREPLDPQYDDQTAPILSVPSLSDRNRHGEDDALLTLIARGDFRRAWRQLGPGHFILAILIAGVVSIAIQEMRRWRSYVPRRIAAITQTQWKQAVLYLGCLVWCIILMAVAYVRINKDQIFASQAAIKERTLDKNAANRNP